MSVWDSSLQSLEDADKREKEGGRERVKNTNRGNESAVKRIGLREKERGASCLNKH